MSQGEIRVEYMPLLELKAAPRNPKQHAIDVIDRSIERFGYVQPPTLDERSQSIVAGHGRLEALNAMKAAGRTPPARIVVREDGEWMVPVLRGITFANDAEAEAYLLADNRASEVGGWDDEELRDMLRDITVQGGSLEGVGFSQEEIAAMVTSAQIEDLKVAPIALVERGKEDLVGVDPRKQQWWVWAKCPDEATMREAIRRFGAGKNKESRELDIKVILAQQ